MKGKGTAASSCPPGALALTGCGVSREIGVLGAALMGRRGVTRDRGARGSADGLWGVTRDQGARGSADGLWGVTGDWGAWGSADGVQGCHRGSGCSGQC